MSFQIISSIDQLKPFTNRFIAYRSNDKPERFSGGYEMDGNSFCYILDIPWKGDEGLGLMCSRLEVQKKDYPGRAITENFLNKWEFKAREITPQEADSIRNLISNGDVCFPFLKDSRELLDRYREKKEQIFTPKEEIL